jgi:hypothetical protein
MPNVIVIIIANFIHYYYMKLIYILDTICIKENQSNKANIYQNTRKLLCAKNYKINNYYFYTPKPLIINALNIQPLRIKTLNLL